jgi:hypothetical protein
MPADVVHPTLLHREPIESNPSYGFQTGTRPDVHGTPAVSA